MHGHRRDRQPLALAAGEVARVAAGQLGQAEPLQLGPARRCARRRSLRAEAVAISSATVSRSRWCAGFWLT